MAAVTYQVADDIAQIAINNPPVNAINLAVRVGVRDAFDQAANDPTAKAIVLWAQGATFPVGADIKEFDKVAADPHLQDLCRQIENCPKPVVVALHGQVLGGGLELALAAHWRIAAPNAQFGLPEVNLGLLPGAGGTQRLPRLIGAKSALMMVLSGKPVVAPRAHKAGLIDQIAQGPLRTAALDMARDIMAKEGTAPRRTCDMTQAFGPAGAYQAAITSQRAAKPDNAPQVVDRIIDCIEAAQLLPFDMGLNFERTAFEDCLASDRSTAKAWRRARE